MDIELYINNGNISTKFDASALCEGEITLTSQRRGSPASLNFNIARDIPQGDKINFAEGNNVSLIVNGYKMFSGYVFTKNRSKDHIIKVTAYDQLRYLNNKDTYVYSNLKASDVLKNIASSFKLKIGDIEDTKYIIDSRSEDNQPLFDIILNALDLTLINTGKMFVLYDDFGSLALKSLENMKLPLMLMSEDISLIDFNCKTDIDSDTYNRVKLYRDNEETKKRDVYQVDDSLSQAMWGILQYYESVPDCYNSAQIIMLAEKILEIKNRIKQSLSIECTAVGIGEEQIRGGSGIMVKIDDIGESGINNWFAVEKCTHSFKNNEHTIKLDLTDWKVV